MLKVRVLALLMYLLTAPFHTSSGMNFCCLRSTRVKFMCMNFHTITYKEEITQCLQEGSSVLSDSEQ